MSEAAILDRPAPPQDPLARMRQLASKVVWLETLGKAKSPIATFNDQGSLPPFYCVHSLSGKATDYSQLSLMLGPELPFHALQIPMANRDATFGALGEVSLVAIAGFYADAITAFQPQGPLALGGWSVGAVLALELAQQLKTRGREVTLLVTFDLAPWDDTMPSLRDPRFLLAVAANLPRYIRRHRLVRGASPRLAADALLMKLGLKRRAHSQVPTLGAVAVGDLVDPALYPPAHRDLMKHLLHACMAYRAQAYDGAVQVYVATTEVPAVHLPLLAAAWRKVAKRLRVTPVEGSHRRMIEEPAGHALAADLLAELRGAASG